MAQHFDSLRQPPRAPLVDELMLREWLPRVLAVLVVGVVGVVFLLYGCNPGKARAAAPVEATATPTAAPPAEPGEKTTILLLGSDQRPEDPTYRTDVIILLTIDPARNTVSALSFPRDLVAKIPGYGDDRINVVMQYGGFELMQETLYQSYGARPQYYFMTNFAGFAGLINSIGGIDVYAAEPLTDACDLYWSRGGVCEIEKGKHAMDGDAALWYARSRHSSSDFDRTRRAQEVMLGIFNRMLNMDVLVRVPELYAQYSQDVETNMPLEKMLPLIPVAAQIAQHPSRLERYTIPEEITANWFMFTGAQVLLPDYEAVKKIVIEAGAAN